MIMGDLHCSLLSMNYGLIWGIVACDFRLLGFPGVWLLNLGSICSVRAGDRHSARGTHGGHQPKALCFERSRGRYGSVGIVLPQGAPLSLSLCLSLSLSVSLSVSLFLSLSLCFSLSLSLCLSLSLSLSLCLYLYTYIYAYMHTPRLWFHGPNVAELSYALYWQRFRPGC